MSLDNVTKILLAGASLCLGAYLTALRAKINSTKLKNKMHYAFYAITVVFFLGALATLFFSWENLFYEKGIFKPNWFAIIVIIMCIVATILLFHFTFKNLAGKYQYKTSELDPIVNKFTENADKKNIKLLAGDINFFGNYPKEMEEHSQYKCLRKEGFRQIQILCTEPKTNEEKIRYGKIISDFNTVELKYYFPPQADLLIRGRLKTLNNVIHLLIYNKIRSGVYEALELDTANSSGVMYNYIWNLIWELAKSPTQEQLNEYVSLYRN